MSVIISCLRGTGAAFPAPLGWDGVIAPATFGWEAGLVAPAAYGWESGLAGTAYGFAPAIEAYPSLRAYGGEGVGDVAVAGEMGVKGVTEIVGKVPILGAVEFGGIVPAAGSVTISGICGCGCKGPYIY
ncbi:unnamed protein product [Euphydryas editha]|uniref:Uncharacterized protein n=1 Tax=Euphydryas editha TaxID=104508 RepID=A0AAU9TGP1_EUPED|nr:unnamed protein product [Euphydryas editha]